MKTFGIVIGPAAKHVGLSLAFIVMFGCYCTTVRGDTSSGSSSSHAPSKAQQVALHLDRGKKFWENNDTDNAVSEWKCVLKLDPDNSEAKELLSEAGVGDAPLQPAPAAPQPVVDPVKHHQEIVTGCNDALQRWSKVVTLKDFADALDDRTADFLARTLMLSYRDAFQSTLLSVDPADPTIRDDYEAFLDANQLSDLLQTMEGGTNPGYSTTRLHGRAFLLAMIPWVTRAEKSKLFLYYRRPAGWQNAANNLDQDTYLEAPGGAVLVDGPSLDDGAPLAAICEDGKWRIGARAGQMFDFDIHIDYPRRLDHK